MRAILIALAMSARWVVRPRPRSDGGARGTDAGRDQRPAGCSRGGGGGGRPDPVGGRDGSGGRPHRGPGRHDAGSRAHRSPHPPHGRVGHHRLGDRACEVDGSELGAARSGQRQKNPAGGIHHGPRRRRVRFLRRGVDAGHRRRLRPGAPGDTLGPRAGHYGRPLRHHRVRAGSGRDRLQERRGRRRRRDGEGGPLSDQAWGEGHQGLRHRGRVLV